MRRIGLSPSQLLTLVTPLVCVFLLYNFWQLGSELRQMKRSLEGQPTLTTAWDEVSEPMTVTVTSTIVSPSAQNGWWFGTGSTMTAHVSSGTAIQPDPTSTQGSYALLSIDSFPFPWPLRFDILNTSFDDVLEGLWKFWQFCRTVYHYPLPPP